MKKVLSIAISCLLIAAFSARPAAAGTRAEADSAKREQFASRVRTEVARLGTGSDARVEVRLRDKTKLVGFISDVQSDTFAVTNLKTGATTQVPYADVAKVRGNNLSTGAKIAIGVAIGVGCVLLLAAILLHSGGD
jgi:hypothetical protein